MAVERTPSFLKHESTGRELKPEATPTQPATTGAGTDDPVLFWASELFLACQPRNLTWDTADCPFKVDAAFHEAMRTQLAQMEQELHASQEVRRSTLWDIVARLEVLQPSETPRASTGREKRKRVRHVTDTLLLLTKPVAKKGKLR